MRSNFLQPSSKYSKLVDDDTRHSLPISQMGNYQDHLKKMPMPLREIESAPVRQHMFGNPFKINKNMIMDEVVMDEVSLVPNGASAGGNQPSKGVKRPVTPDSPGPLASKRLRKGTHTHGVILLHIPAIVYNINTLDGLGSQMWEGQGRAL